MGNQPKKKSIFKTVVDLERDELHQVIPALDMLHESWPPTLHMVESVKILQVFFPNSVFYSYMQVINYNFQFDNMNFEVTIEA